MQPLREETELAFARLALERFRNMGEERIECICVDHGHDPEQFRAYIKDQIAMCKWTIADLERDAAT